MHAKRVVASKTRRSRALLVVLVVAAAVRLAPIPFHRFAVDRVTTVDSSAYLELAGNLEQGRGFVRRSGDGEPTPEVFRTPGYPLLVAAVSQLPGPLLVWLVLLQISAGVGVVFATHRLAATLWDSRAATVAAVVVAVDVGHVVHANLVMSDIAAAVAVVTAFALAIRGRRPTAMLAAGALLSAAVAFRPVVSLLWLPLALLLVARRVRTRVVVGSVALALVFPAVWTVRNGLTAGAWTVSTAFDVNLSLLTGPKVVARADGVSLTAAQEEFAERVSHLAAVHPDASEHRLQRRVGLAAIANHPTAAMSELAVSCAEMVLAGERRHVLRLFGHPNGRDDQPSVGESDRTALGISARLGRLRGVEVVVVSSQLVFNASVLLLALAGAWQLYRSGRQMELAVIVAALALVLLPSLVVATGRMRIPVTFLIATLAGVGGGAMLQRWRGSDDCYPVGESGRCGSDPPATGSRTDRRQVSRSGYEESESRCRVTPTPAGG